MLVLELVLEIEVALALDIECYHITASVSHLTCPLPPHQSVIWLALYHRITALPHWSVILLAPCHHISQSFDLPTATASPHWSVIWLAPTTTSVSHLTCPHHHISQSFDLPPATTSGSHLTCPLPPHQYVPTTPSTSSNSSASASARELEIIEKFLCPHHL